MKHRVSDTLLGVWYPFGCTPKRVSDTRCLIPNDTCIGVKSDTRLTPQRGAVWYTPLKVLRECPLDAKKGVDTFLHLLVQTGISHTMAFLSCIQQQTIKYKKYGPYIYGEIQWKLTETHRVHSQWEVARISAMIINRRLSPTRCYSAVHLLSFPWCNAVLSSSLQTSNFTEYLPPASSFE